MAPQPILYFLCKIGTLWLQDIRQFLLILPCRFERRPAPRTKEKGGASWPPLLCVLCKYVGVCGCEAKEMGKFDKFKIVGVAMLTVIVLITILVIMYFLSTGTGDFLRWFVIICISLLGIGASLFVFQLLIRD